MEKETKTEPAVEKTVKEKKGSKKLIVLGVLLLLIIAALVVAYKYGEKINSSEEIAKKAYEQLVEDGTIDDKYLVESLDSEDSFVSFEDNLKAYLEDEDIKLNDNYDVKGGKKKVTIKFKNKKDKYEVKFTFEKEGKAMFIYDKYLISKITIKEKDDYKEHVLYTSKGSEKMTISTVKGSKLTINGKDIKESFIDKKQSDDETDVYVIKGVVAGDYDVEYSIGGFVFERELTVYEKDDNEFDLTDYISSYYVKEDEDRDDEIAEAFKKYLTKYYEIATDESKTIEDFKKEYEVTKDIESNFNDTRDQKYYKSIKIDKVTYNSFSYDAEDQEFEISYKVEYTYTTEASPEGRDSYSYTRATYSVDDLDNPIDLSYLPY